MPRRRPVTAWTALLVGLVVAGVLIGTRLGGGAREDGSTSTGAATSAESTASASAGAEPGAGGSGGGMAGASATPRSDGDATESRNGSGSGSGSGSGGGAPTGSGSGDRATEVLPDQPEETVLLPGLDGAAGAPRSTDPLIDSPLPEQGSATGALVRGYPVRVLPAAPGSRVATSSVSGQGTTLQVALEASSPRAGEAVLGFYRDRLGRLGFAEGQSPAIGGSFAASFSRGDDSVVVTVLPGDGPSSYTLFATLHAARA